MKNISATTASINMPSSSSTEHLPSKTEGIAWCSAFALEAVVTAVRNSLTIVLFAVNKNLRKRSLFLVINMAFADLLGAVTLTFYIYAVVGDAYQLYTDSKAADRDFFYNYSSCFLACHANVRGKRNKHKNCNTCKNTRTSTLY